MVSGSETKRIPKHVLARLIKKSMKGDLKAFNEVYKVFIKTIYFNVSCSLNDKADIDDAVQQVVISMFKGLSQLESPYAFHSYLYRITNNVCWNFNQKEEKHRHSSITELEEELVDDKSITPEESWEKTQDIEMVRKFISKLPEKQRYALMLYYYYDMTYKDIAEAMDSDINVVGSNIYRAKQNIKQMWEEYDVKATKTEHVERTEPAEPVKSDKLAELDHQHASYSVFAIGLAGYIDTIVEPSKIEALWKICTISAPELFVVGVAIEAKQATLKTVVTSVVAAVTVACLGIVAFQNIVHDQATPDHGEQVQPALFIPEEVSIVFLGTTPNAPEIYNPTGASILLSEGTPQTWRILDSAKNEVAQGAGSTFNQNIFENLPEGTYLVEWTIADDNGNTGIARREFIIEEIEQNPS